MLKTKTTNVFLLWVMSSQFWSLFQKFLQLGNFTIFKLKLLITLLAVFQASCL